MSNQLFARARDYIFTHGRPLDRMLFNFHFADGSAAVVQTALAAFQNDDGGFGRALEPDLRTPASSAIATSTGLDILRRVDAPAGSPLVQQALAYLHDTVDPVRRVWPIVPPAVEAAPHAPWWAFASSAENFGDFLVNPRVALLGHFWHFAPPKPADFIADLTTETLDYLATHADDLGMHDIYCYQGLAAARLLPPAMRDQIQRQLLPAVRRKLNSAPAQWGAYGLLPLDIAPRPDALFAGAVSDDLIQVNLAWLMEKQQEDGAWPLAWSWDFVDADAWARAERDWRGHLAVENLCRLQAYGRLEQ